MKLASTILAAAGTLAAALPAFAAEPAATAEIVVYADAALGVVKPMNAVNNGPSVGTPLGDQRRGNSAEYAAARIPFARTHDSNLCYDYGAPHTVDVTAVFPDFDADENDPANYDFVCTDRYLDAIRRTGTRIFYRLGQSIEHGPKKYGVFPPEDPEKWARVCEKIIRHYNEGWGWGADKSRTTINTAWSNQFDIVYWEIWNEPDLDPVEKGTPKNPRCWGGSVEEFFSFYEIAAKRLKASFPNLNIGGPAVCGRMDWSRRFLQHCAKTATPLDFFSWHIYCADPRKMAEKAVRVRKMLDDCGFASAESILNEWNYVKGWGDDWRHSLEVESGRFNQKGAAFTAAAMADLQDAPLDMLMYYDARIGTSMNGMFDPATLWPVKGYYPFYAWSKLAERGTQVKCEVREGRGEKSDAATGVLVPDSSKAPASGGQFRAVAAKGADGSLAVFVVRYSPGEETDTGAVVVRVEGRPLAGARCHVTDAARVYTEVAPEVRPDGSVRIRLMPDSFALLEL